MITKEQARAKIKEFIEKYTKYKEDKNLMKNERQICDSLIRPFFRDILGWNIDDPYEFKSEYSQGGKRIDYMACLDGVSQFVIEAKAPSKDIKDNSKHYKQTIQYAEAKDKDFAILTNFRNFIIFRAGIETRGPFANEIITIDLLNLTDKGFDFLWYFSKNFWIEKGEENPLYSIKNIKKKKKIDEKLVEDMTKWREYLLRSLKATSKQKYDFEDEKELLNIEEEIQRFIDRLIFICFCEDKQLNDNELKPLLLEKRSHLGKPFLLPKLKDLFREYNKTYNSDLFKEGICDEFVFDESILQEILEDLRTPILQLPYDFSIIDIDVLGRAYESFLGHVITGKKRFKEKKDIGKRKKEGIYYTPQYIVNYIVKNTIREKIKGKSFDEILKIKILDPACGSGSFLIKAFDILIQESEIKLKRELTYEEKKELMLNCIFGVDKDERACDIAKLSLSLKLATRGKKIPLLHNNIKNGNSLIDDERVDPIHAFKWEKEFPFKFDVVVGNPPYNAELSPQEKDYIKSKYKKLHSGDTAEYFLRKSIEILNKRGTIGFIVPKSIAYYEKWKDVRKSLIENFTIFRIGDVGLGFSDVNLEEIILIFNKKTITKDYQILVEKFGDLKKPKDEKTIIKSNLIKYSIMEDKNVFIFTPLSNPEQEIIKKIDKKSIRFSDIIKDSFRGVYISDKDKLSLKEGPIKFIEKEPWIQRYYVQKFIKINIKEPFIEEKKINKILNQKLIFKVMRGKRLTIHYDSLGELLTASNIVNVIIEENCGYDYKVLLGLFNSTLFSFYIQKSLFSDTTESARHMDYPYLAIFPIPKKHILEKKYQSLIDFVDKMLLLKKKINKIGKLSVYEKERLEQQIKNIDYEIDQEVYKLYNITSEEQKIIEESLK